MSVQMREVLNADGMSLGIYCGGQSKVGIGLTGTWVGTVAFYGSTDGANFSALSVTPFASGTAVSSTTANGNFFVNALNYTVIKVVFTRTSGSVTVKLAVANDGSYQDAFLASSSLYVTNTASGAVNTLTQTAQANRAWKLKKLKISLSAQPSWLTSPNLQIKDGSTVLWALDLPPSGSSGIIYDVVLPDDGIINTPGADMSIVVASAQGSVKSIINAEFSAA